MSQPEIKIESSQPEIKNEDVQSEIKIEPVKSTTPIRSRAAKRGRELESSDLVKRAKGLPIEEKVEQLANLVDVLDKKYTLSPRTKTILIRKAAQIVDDYKALDERLRELEASSEDISGSEDETSEEEEEDETSGEEEELEVVVNTEVIEIN